MRNLHFLILTIPLFLLSACSTTSFKTVELSNITHEQALSLQKSHNLFIKRYYKKLREDALLFLDTKWTSSFLSKAVNKEQFRKALDEAYLLSGIKASDLDIKWKGRGLVEPQKSAIESSIKRMASEERSRLGEVLLGFAKAAQKQINKMRNELIEPINRQEQLVLSKVNEAWADLLAGQSAITAHLKSVVTVKESQDKALKQLGILEDRNKLLDTLIEYDEKFSDVFGNDESAENVLKDFKKKLAELEEKVSSGD